MLVITDAKAGTIRLQTSNKNPQKDPTMITVRTLRPHRHIDENMLAQAIAEREGLKEQVNIAQIKEVQRHLLDLLGETLVTEPAAVIALIAEHTPSA